MNFLKTGLRCLVSSSSSTGCFERPGPLRAPNFFSFALNPPLLFDRFVLVAGGVEEEEVDEEGGEEE